MVTEILDSAQFEAWKASQQESMRITEAATIARFQDGLAKLKRTRTAYETIIMEFMTKGSVTITNDSLND